LEVIFLVLKNDVSKRQFVFYVLDCREEEIKDLCNS
jgi:hypothetical protein